MTEAEVDAGDPGGEDDLPADLAGAIRRLPKAELHLHLDGSLRPATAVELARERGIAAPRGVAEMRRRLVAPMPCPDQARLLDAFALPVSLLQDGAALERVASELVEDLAAEGTTYAEIRWAPTLHMERGLALRDGIGAVVRGARAAARTRGVTVRLIAVILRTHDVERAVAMAHAASAFAGDGVAGIDLAGREAAAPDPLPFLPAFGIARAAGLGVTCHAAEWGGPAQVRRALALEPDRIAHGAASAEDPALVAELRARGITLDLCPTSNRQAGLYPALAHHPLVRLHRAGVAVTLSTDDRTVSDLTLTREIGRAIGRLGATFPEIVAMTRTALRAAFLADDEPERARLLAALEAFAAGEPLLAASR